MLCCWLKGRGLVTLHGYGMRGTTASFPLPTAGVSVIGRTSHQRLPAQGVHGFRALALNVTDLCEVGLGEVRCLWTAGQSAAGVYVAQESILGRDYNAS